MIPSPGIYQDYPEQDYHADPCPEPSLSRSLAKLLIEKTPRHAFIAHPRLDPNCERKKEEYRFEFGSAGHTALLTRGKRTIRIDGYDDWRKDAAKALRDEARAHGLIPLLPEQYARVQSMREAVLEQLPEHGLSHLFDTDHGRAEVVIAGIDPVAGWVRCMADWLEQDMTFWDVKITSVDLNDEAIGRHCSAMGYEWQPAFYERVAATVEPELRDNIQFNFLFVEDKPPFQILPVRLPADAMAKGRANVARACELWAKAKRENAWPRWVTKGVRTVEYPPWAVAEYVNHDG